MEEMVQIEELKLSKKCTNQLKRSGFADVEDIVFFFENAVANATITSRTSTECFGEAVDRLVELGLLPEERWKR
jgi:DNA-directed RNA polymerase alpha subunit